jgi:predicted Zn-dependent peptidase
MESIFLFIMKNENWSIFKLPNGIRVIYLPNESIISHVALIVNVGSRDELKNEHGLAHFIEHLIFKGTKKRKAYHIISCLENSGGELNAYTAKEETCIHASCLKENIGKALELISDVLYNSIFPEKEIEKEKLIVLDEINSYKDNPAEMIFDDFEEFIFPNSSLGSNILGTPTSIKKYNRNDIINFIRKSYSTEQMVIAITGNLDCEKIKKLCAAYFNKSINIGIGTTRQKPRYKTVNQTLYKKIHQSHCIIGNQAYSYHSDKRLATHLLSNLLAGPGMNTRLNLILREKLGLTYNIESLYTPFSDTGIFMVYFGSNHNDVNKSIEIIHKEFNKLKITKLGTLQLHRSKQQLIGQWAISLENQENMMFNMGKSLLIYDQVENINEVNKKIEAVTDGQIIEIANELFNPSHLSTLVYTSKE